MREDSRQEEMLAAFVDGELAADEIDALLARLECDRSRGQLCRQMMVTHALSGGRVQRRDISLSLRAALRQEAPLARPRRRVLRPLRFSRRFAVPAGGLALAASVGLAAVIVSQPPAVTPTPAMAEAPVTVPAGPHPAAGQDVARTQTVAAVTDSSGSQELVIKAPESGQRQITAQWASAPADNPRSRLDSYLINHARHGGGYGLSGPLGYARIAAQSSQLQGEPAP